MMEAETIHHWLDHLIVMPIILPLLASAIMLAVNERRRALKRIISLVTTVILIAIATQLVMQVEGSVDGISGPRVYQIGNWAAPFGITLVADRLSVMMVLLSGILGYAALAYALARWDREGPRFHVLFLLLLTGINGAFLTGDIFNLFVFFEVLLAASYGLALHGAGEERTSASLHYIIINITASLFFLIGVALIYGQTGTLNMADLAIQAAKIPPDNLMLYKSGIIILGIAFLVKSGAWPFNFWLVRTYSASVPPIAAMFAIMTKVGIYAILRLGTLLTGLPDQNTANIAGIGLVTVGFATMVYGTLGVLGARTLKNVTGHYVLISSGTLIAALGIGGVRLTSAALYYLISSTLAIAALYLMIEPVERNARRDHGQGDTAEPVFEDEYSAIIEEDEDEIGIVIPGTIAILGGGFIFCTLLLAGLPPLPGFLAKFAIIDAIFTAPEITVSAWVLATLMVFAGLATLVALTRAGIDLLWTPSEDDPPPLSVIEATPIGLLLAVCVGFMVYAAPLFHYMEGTSGALKSGVSYINAVNPAQHNEGAP